MSLLTLPPISAPAHRTQGDRILAKTTHPQLSITPLIMKGFFQPEDTVRTRYRLFGQGSTTRHYWRLGPPPSLLWGCPVPSGAFSSILASTSNTLS